MASLDHIVAAARRRVSQCQQAANLRELERRAEEHRPRGFRRALEKTAQASVAIIAELKKASPSCGLIREDFHVTDLAQQLAASGATALSVLTDEEFFQGSLENLRLASAATTLPCLRKDFIVDEFQLLEARAHRADAVLLIVAALSAAELQCLANRGRQLGLDILCEVHEEEELRCALDAGCDLVGVNSRDLRTFEVNLNTAVRLARSLPKNAVRVAESGIHCPHDIARLRAHGYQAFLIGEWLMKAPSPGQALRSLIEQVSAAPCPTPGG